jgi:hypothetical protein
MSWLVRMVDLTACSTSLKQSGGGVRDTGATASMSDAPAAPMDSTGSTFEASGSGVDPTT